MHLNCSGFLALTDAMIFIAVIMIASAVIASDHGSAPTDTSDAGDILDAIVLTEVRMSDLSDDGDGSLVRFTDLLAMDVLGGGGRASEYAGDLLGRICAGRPYSMTIGYSESELRMGGDLQDWTQSVRRTVAVSTGGELTMELVLLRS